MKRRRATEGRGRTRAPSRGGSRRRPLSGRSARASLGWHRMGARRFRPPAVRRSHAHQHANAVSVGPVDTRVARVAGSSMKSQRILLPGLLALAACSQRDGSAPAQSVAERVPLHGHASGEEPSRVFIGEVRAIDRAAGTVDIERARSPANERRGSGAPERLRATAQQLGQVQIGEVVEVRAVTDGPYRRVITINGHAHRQAKGLPSP